VVDLGNRQVTIMQCDTIGQEQFRSIVPLYLPGTLRAIVAAAADSGELFVALPQ
jgi:GTPase SAR1 family protein